MTDHLDDDQISDYVDRERAKQQHPVDVSRHLASCDACRASALDELAVVDALRRYGHLEAPRAFAVPEGTPVLLRPGVSVWTSVASLAASIVLFLSVAATVRVGASRPTAAAPVSAVSAASSRTSDVARSGGAAGQAAPPAAAPIAAAPAAGSAPAPNAARQPGGAAASTVAPDAGPPATAQRPAALAGHADSAAPAPSSASSSARPPNAEAPVQAQATAASGVTRGAPVGTPEAAAAAQAAPSPAATVVESKEQRATARAEAARQPGLAPWQVVALAASLALLVFGIATLWLETRGRPGRRVAGS